MTNEKLNRFTKLNKQANLGGGKERISQQHKKNKFTARERIKLLLDENSFIEIDKFVVHNNQNFDMDKTKILGDGVVTGYGKINNKKVFVFANDFTVLGGSLSVSVGKKICKIMDLALKTGCPIIGLNDSGGARIQEGVESLAAYSQIFYRNTLLSGIIPQISVILGPSAGGSVYSPAMTDFTIMVENISNMFITGPEVVKTALGEDVTFEELGGAQIHAEKSGVANFIAKDEVSAINIVKQLLSYLPQNNSEDSENNLNYSDNNVPVANIQNIVPQDANKSYDMKELICTIVDENNFFEISSLWAPNIIIGFGYIGGKSVGIVANQPNYLSGSLDINASNKAARFIRFCDAFNIPIITFVDVPGYLPGTEQEHGGAIRHGSKLLYAYCEATVPKITIIIRKAYGGAYCAMGSKYSKSDINLAWFSAEIAVMGPEAALNILYKKELNGDKNNKIRSDLLNKYREQFANPYIAAGTGIIDEVIVPEDTKNKIIKSLEMLEEKREIKPLKKHGNIQL